MTTFEQWRNRANRLEGRWLEPKPRKYDIRVVDQFFAYCQTVSRTARHRDDARDRAHEGAKRTLRALLIAGSFVAYYIVERVAQAMTLF